MRYRINERVSVWKHRPSERHWSRHFLGVEERRTLSETRQKVSRRDPRIIGAMGASVQERESLRWPNSPPSMRLLGQQTVHGSAHIKVGVEANILDQDREAFVPMSWSLTRYPPQNDAIKASTSKKRGGRHGIPATFPLTQKTGTHACPKCLATIHSTTCSRLMPLESSVTASFAGRRGATARVLSASSRRWRSARTSWTSASWPLA